MRKFAGSIVRCHFYRHWFWPQKFFFGLLSSASEKILKNGFHHAKEHFDLDFSAYHSAEFSGILPFGYRHEKAKSEKKRNSIQSVSWPNLSTDVSFSGNDFGRKKKIRLSNFGYEKDTEKRISQCEKTLWDSFFGLSFGRNFRDFTFPIPQRKAGKR